MQFLRSTWLVFTMHLAAIAGSRRALVGIVLAAIPPLLGFLCAQLLPENAEGRNILAFLGTFLLILVIVPLLSIALGVGVIADEADARTITYPFTRPIHRTSFFLGRWGATLLVVLALLGASAVGLALSVSLRGGAPTSDLAMSMVAATLVGGLVYTLGAAVVGVVAKRGLVVALGYAFAIEGLMINVPGSAQKLTIQYHLRSFFIDKSTEPWSEIEFPAILMVDFLSPAEAQLKMAVIAALLLATGCWVVTRKQFVLSS